MTEKEKQIIEMAGDMSFASTKVDLYLDDRKEIAKVLYLLGYRLIPDGAVVLTKEKKKKLFHEMYEQGKFDAIAELEMDGKVVLTKEEYKKLKTISIPQ